MTSQLQSNGGTASPQTTLEFETTIEQCNEEWAKDYRSKWDSYPIQDLILEILARSCYYTQKNMHPTIKINFYFSSCLIKTRHYMTFNCFNTFFSFYLLNSFIF